MNVKKLRDEVETQLKYMNATVAELKAMLLRLRNGEPTGVEKAGAGACLGQLYGGLERILLRICRHLGIPVPSGDDWHHRCFQMFCEPPARSLPLLFDREMEAALIPYRSFRHLFVHGYGVMLDWDRMEPGVRAAEEVFRKFEERVRQYLDSLEEHELGEELGSENPRKRKRGRGLCESERETDMRRSCLRELWRR